MPFALNSHRTGTPCFFILLIPVFFLFLSFSISAQIAGIKPLSGVCKLTEQYLQIQTGETQKQLDKMSEKWRKEASVILKERNALIPSACNKQLLITDTGFTAFYEQVFNKMIVSNNLQHVPLKLFISKDPSPNAYSLGEGSIVLQIGLIPHLKNEEELAFVLAHELAHYMLDHSTQRLVQYFKKIYDPATQAQIKDLSKQTYQSKSSALQFMETLQLGQSRHSRFSENEADSLALQYTVKAGYNPWLATRVMESLDAADADDFSIDYKHHFTLSGFNYNPAWTKKVKTLGATKALPQTEMTDSLKTHPDCKIRLQTLQNLIGGKPPAPHQAAATTSDAVRSKKVTFALVQAYFDLGRYDESLYHALRLCRENREDAFGYFMVVKSLEACYKAYQNHELGKHVKNPSGQYVENFNELLLLLQRITLSDFKTLTQAFAQQHLTPFAAKDPACSQLLQNVSSL